MEPTLKRKVTVRLAYNESSSRPPSRTARSRPPSPVKPDVSMQSSLTAPASRLRAKVNSSATPASRKPASSVSSSSRTPANSHGSGAGTSVSVTPRAGSPAKSAPRARAAALSPTFQPKVRTIVRPPATKSTPGTPELRNRSLTTTFSDIGHLKDSRSRHGSVSLHHTVSFSSLQTSNTPSGSRSSTPVVPSEPIAFSDQEGHYLPARIKAKVSGMAKPTSDSLASSPTLPSHPIAQPISRTRTRAPSIPSNVPLHSTSPPSSAEPPAFYPITTATSAANPHRFTPIRPSPPLPAHHYYQPFHQLQDDPRVDYSRHDGVAKVDPTTIPLPANSPPASAVSFSSHSSLSRSSVSHATNPVDSPTPHQNDDTDRLRSTLDNLIQYNETSSREDNYSGDSGQDRETHGKTNGAERKVKAEAKSIRKIADLEITNRSLLAINASLEIAKHRQAKEIRELRRKLRESRLILPPRAYRAVKSSLDHDDTADENDEDEDDTEEIETKEVGGDEVYHRIKVILEGLLETGKKALETKAEDFSESGRGVAKVLNAEEIRTWRDSSSDISDRHLENDIDGIPVKEQLSPSRIAVPASDDDFQSEDEVEAMMLPTNSTLSSPAPPPILITESS